jgi:hypothetical protein
VARLDAGPQAIALTFRPDRERKDALANSSDKEWEWRGERLVYPRGSEDDDELLSLAAGILDRVDAN